MKKVQVTDSSYCRPGKSRLFVPRQPSPTSNAIDTRIGIDPGAVFVVVDLLLFFLLFVPDFCSCFLLLLFSWTDNDDFFFFLVDDMVIWFGWRSGSTFDTLINGWDKAFDVSSRVSLSVMECLSLCFKADAIIGETEKEVHNILLSFWRVLPFGSGWYGIVDLLFVYI